VDLSAAEKLNGRGWFLAKAGAFICFGVACGLMIASLFFMPGARAGSTVAALPIPVPVQSK
jgi:hypothetical protein